ncbi:ATP-binding region [compost metagenome]
MHGVRRELLISQAESIGIPVKMVHLPSGSDMQGYENAMNQAIRELKSEGISDCIFGDIFLEDLRTYREQKLKEAGISAHFPLWKRETDELIREFVDLGFKTVVVCTDSSKLNDTFAGRIIDRNFIADLPENVDPCGENGEFHTFVFDGPVFKTPVSFELGEKVHKTYPATNARNEAIEYRFCFQDLIPVYPRI